MVDNPTDVTYVNGVPVDKDSVKAKDKINSILVLADAAALQNTNSSLQQVILLKSTGRVYVLDTGSLGPDDGVRIIRSLDGNWFTIVEIDGLDGIDGASALTVIRVVATANVAISTALENGDALDGVTLATNDLVLLAGQSAPAQNGVYVVPASGGASRAAAFSTYDEHPGRYFSVMEGTAGADKLYRCTSNKGGTLGTTAIVMSEFTSSNPATDDGGSLGTTSLKWSDLFLAAGAVINFNSGDVTITHSSNEIAVGGGRLRCGSVAADPFGGTFQTDALQICQTSASFLLKATAASANNRMMDISHASVGIFSARFLDDTFSTGTSIFNVTRSNNDVFQTSFYGGAGVEQFRLTASHAYYPQIGTTASAANAFLNSGSTPANELLRSTSSLAYKRDVEPVEQQYSDKVLDLAPIWYRSNASNDNPEWSWYGLGAEDVAAVDPRLVHWGYQHDDFDMVDQERVEIVERKIETIVDGKTVFETIPHELKTVFQERVLKEGAKLKPDGVMYDRVAVLLLDVVKRLEARVAELEIR